MPQDNGIDDVIFEPEGGEPPSVPSDKTQGEIASFGKGEPKSNTMYVQLWGKGYLSFNPDNSVSVFALISLVLLLVVLIIVSIVGAFVDDPTWLEKLVTGLSLAISAVIGAIVGSASSRAKK